MREILKEKERKARIMREILKGKDKKGEKGGKEGKGWGSKIRGKLVLHLDVRLKGKGKKSRKERINETMNGEGWMEGEKVEQERQWQY